MLYSTGFMGVNYVKVNVYDIIIHIFFPKCVPPIPSVEMKELEKSFKMVFLKLQ